MSAYQREVKRIVWFLHTAHTVNTTLPINVAVSGQRYRGSEAILQKAGAGILPVPHILSPAWASKWHRLSFNKIAALSMTQFDRVIVVDNDVALLRNMDHLSYATSVPAATFHITLGPLARKTRCAVTSGLLVLQPSVNNFQIAMRILNNMSYDRQIYDGGDEEFWHAYFRYTNLLYELPMRYHTHRLVSMPIGDWHRVHMLHLINNFAGRNKKKIPTTVSRVEKYFN